MESATEEMKKAREKLMTGKWRGGDEKKEKEQGQGKIEKAEIAMSSKRSGKAIREEVKSWKWGEEYEERVNEEGQGSRWKAENEEKGEQEEEQGKRQKV